MMPNYSAAPSDIEAYFDLLREGETSVEPDLKREIDSLSEYVDQLESRTMLSDENDALNAIVTVHPGAGGTESQDWAEMLMRMYLRWAERQGFKTEINELPGWRRGRHQVRHLHRHGRVRLRPALRRNRRAPPGAHLAVRSGQAPPHLLRQRLRLA